jgi:alkanesulfonate monooxygenase SsuD/methylene tetrahydromethanopterin reductase-like flavin-dependent oxidoreductase (luciferase family)
VVPRIRLGSLVCGNTYRHPAVLAKQAASADIISGGRIVLGVGAGWQENEHQAYGIPFYDTKERLARLDEACQVVTGLLRNERTTFDGRYYKLEDAPLEPKPANPQMPLLVGGGGEKVTMRIAAQYADEWNVWGTPELLAQKGEVLERHCSNLGRDPKQIKRSANALLFMSEDEEFLAKRREAQMPMPAIIGTPDDITGIVKRYAEAGVDELIVPDFTLGPTDRKLATYDTFLAAARA